MLVKTSRFGEVTVEDSAVITFPEGIVGFPDIRGFVMFDGPEGTPFKWLQSTERPELAFPESRGDGLCRGTGDKP